MSILHIAGIAKDNGTRRLQRLLASLDREKVKDVTDKVLEGTRSIGERHEGITSALEDASVALGQLHSVESGLEKARKALEAEFEARREERSEIVALNALLEHVRQELNAGGARETDLQDRLRRTDSALEEVKGARAEAEANAANREAEAARLNSALATATAERVELAAGLEQIGKQVAHLQEEKNSLRARLDETDARRQEAETKVATLSQANALLESDRNALERRGEAHAAEIARLGRTIGDLEGRLSAEETRSRGLDTALTTAQSEVGRLTQALEEQTVSSKIHLETADMRLDTAQARATRLEEENTSLGRQVQETLVRERGLERELADARQRGDRADDRIRVLEADLLSTRQEQISSEGARAASVERSERLNETLQGRHSDVKRLEEQIDVLQSRISSLEADLSNERAQGGERARSLTDLIERERSEHSIAQGALESARKDRARLHLELLKIARRRPTDELDEEVAVEDGETEAKAG